MATNNVMNSRAGYKNEEVVSCPYNFSHRLMFYKLQTHLVKCRRFHSDAKLAPCKFNASHLVPEPEMEIHLISCPDRVEIDKYLYVQDNLDTDKYPIHRTEIESEENWDELDQATYNPEEILAKKPVLRKIDTKSAAVRRDFRLENIARCRELTSNSGATYKPEDGVHLLRKPPVAVARETEKIPDEEDPVTITRMIREVENDFKITAEAAIAKQKNPPPLSEILVGLKSCKISTSDDESKENAWCLPKAEKNRARRNARGSSNH